MTAPSNQNIYLSDGLLLPAVGLGTFKITGTESVMSSLQHAFANGYRLIDTATFYENEADIGISLKELGTIRKDIFITTKLAPTDQGKEKAGAAIEKSLADLGTDYIDLYLIHWPGVIGFERNDEKIKNLRLESWKIMEDYHKRGILRAIGVSNYEVRHLEEVLASGTVAPHVNQIEVHPQYQNRDVIAFCKAKGIHVTAYTSLGRANSTLFTDPSVVKVAEECGKTVAQVLLKWGLAKGCSIIPKSSNKDRIRENIDLDFDLSSAQIKCLDDIQLEAKVSECDPRNVI
jgi:diketogulonate reductase-like aldo/keto reductase